MKLADASSGRSTSIAIAKRYGSVIAHSSLGVSEYWGGRRPSPALKAYNHGHLTLIPSKRINKGDMYVESTHE